jgi:oligopeptide/dipeptide ABC transporter ATP-binding protein
MAETLLKIDGLRVSFHGRDGVQSRPLRGVNLEVARGEVHSLVGESGSGKTLTATCVLGLLPVPPARIEGGSILFQGRELLGLAEGELRRLRGRRIGMVFQEPSKYLNPAMRVGEQIVEALVLHLGLGRPDALARAGELLELVGLPGGRKVLRRYPHELSGGMRQRVMIAMAVSCDPALLIADEPTTALDVTLQRQILRLLLELRERLGMTVLFVSHDLAVVRGISERISVIYCGKVVESGSRENIFTRPLHPYTQALLASVPEASRRGTALRAIPGTVPDASHVPAGCAFHPRCPLAVDRCREEIPELLDYAARRPASGGPIGPAAPPGFAPAQEPADKGVAAGGPGEPDGAHLAACHRIGET